MIIRSPRSAGKKESAQVSAEEIAREVDYAGESGSSRSRQLKKRNFKPLMLEII